MDYTFCVRPAWARYRKIPIIPESQGEEITGYKIQSVYTQGDTKICTVDILINEKPFVKSIVHVKEIGDEYQIVGINLNWKR